MRGCCNTMNGYFSLFVPACSNPANPAGAITDPDEKNSTFTYAAHFKPRLAYSTMVSKTLLHFSVNSPRS